MSPELERMISDSLSSEEQLRLMEIHEMNQSHKACLQGLKRFHRYRAMDRERHVLMLCNFMVEHFHIEPSISVAYSTPSGNLSLHESLRFMHDKGLLQIESLEKAQKMAYEECECNLGDYLGAMIKDQSMEVSAYYKLCAEFKRENADQNYLSHELHKKYKCKERVKFNFKGAYYETRTR